METFYTSCMDITLVSRESIFNGLVLREKVDEEVLHKLIHSDLLKETWNKMVEKTYTNEKETLMNYRRIVKDGYAYVMYHKNDYGRCASDRGLSYLNIRREVRHTVGNVHMVDLDIENCHPVLMVQMLEKQGFPCVYLKDYVQNRDKYFRMVSDTWQFENRDYCKRFFLRLMYGGTYKNWEIDCQLEHLEKGNLPDDLVGFINEVHSIIDLFVSLNEDLYQKILKKKDKNQNHRGSVCSTVMLEKENLVLEIIYAYLARRCRTNVISLCADGIMMERCTYHPSLLKELEVEVFCKTGFVIKMTQKEMDQGYTDLDAHVVEDVAFKPNTNYKAINAILNRMTTLLSEFQNSNYYVENMKCLKEKGNDVHS